MPRKSRLLHLTLQSLSLAEVQVEAELPSRGQLALVVLQLPGYSCLSQLKLHSLSLTGVRAEAELPSLRQQALLVLQLKPRSPSLSGVQVGAE